MIADMPDRRTDLLKHLHQRLIFWCPDLLPVNGKIYIGTELFNHSL